MQKYQERGKNGSGQTKMTMAQEKEDTENQRTLAEHPGGDANPARVVWEPLA